MTVYLNYATTAWPRRPEALKAFLDACDSPPQDLRHSSVDDRDGARRRIAAALGAAPSTVYFVSDATTAINCVVHGTARARRSARTAFRVLADNRSHNALLRPAHEAAGEGLSIVHVHRVDETYDPLAFDAVGGAPDLVALTHTSNVTGSVYDIERIIADVRRRFPHAHVLVDASQSAGATDVSPALAADFVVFPGHKHLAAPPGAAVLIAARPLENWITGGTGASTLEIGTPAPAENFLEVGTGNAPAELAVAAAIENSVENDVRLQDLVERLWRGLSAVTGVRLLGREPGGARTATVAFEPLVGAASTEWATGLRHHGVMARGGLQCSPVHHGQLGLAQGTVRFSLGWASSDEDVDAAVDTTRELATALRAAHV